MPSEGVIQTVQEIICRRSIADCENEWDTIESHPQDHHCSEVTEALLKALSERGWFMVKYG